MNHDQILETQKGHVRTIKSSCLQALFPLLHLAHEGECCLLCPCNKNLRENLFAK